MASEMTIFSSETVGFSHLKTLRPGDGRSPGPRSCHGGIEETGDTFAVGHVGVAWFCPV